MEDFSVRLRKLRKRKGLRQRELADRLGLAQTTIANYEQNIRFPDQRILKRIADHFDVSLDTLLGRDEFGPEPMAERDSGTTIPMMRNAGGPAAVALQYLDLLLRGDGGGAGELVFRTIEAGVDPRDIYLRVLEPALKRVGDLWVLSRANIAQEHFVSAATLEIMNELRKRFPQPVQGARSMLGAAVPGELHEIGLQMVVDFFLMDGWEVRIMGPNAPVQSILASLEMSRIDLLALSANLSYNLESLAQVIEAVRRRKPRIPILVGGQALKFSKDTWKEIGADGHAEDPEKAVLLAAKLVPRAA